MTPNWKLTVTEESGFCVDTSCLLIIDVVSVTVPSENALVTQVDASFDVVEVSEMFDEFVCDVSRVVGVSVVVISECSVVSSIKTVLGRTRAATDRRFISCIKPYNKHNSIISSSCSSERYQFNRCQIF